MHPTFGRYELLKRLAGGGMGEVYLARQRGLDGFQKLLVIKTLLPHLCEDEEFITMFKDEARLTAQLIHPNICQVFEFDQVDGTYFLAMEYLRGEDLRRLCKACEAKDQPLRVALICRIVSDACAGLDFAHALRDEQGAPYGIVHRDISPQNILVSFEGGVKLIDFGVAKAAGRAQHTRTGALKGKYSYMSPEQVAGRSVDGRTDLFALGIVLHELLTGRRLFKADSDVQTLERVRVCNVPPPSSLNPQLPGGLDAIVLKALARDPDARYQTGQELRLALEDWLIQGRMSASTAHLAEFLKVIYAARLDKEARLGPLLGDAGLVAPPERMKTPSLPPSGGVRLARPAPMGTPPPGMLAAAAAAAAQPAATLNERRRTSSDEATPSADLSTLKTESGWSPFPRRGNSAAIAVAIGVVVVGAAAALLQRSPGPAAIAAPMRPAAAATSTLSVRSDPAGAVLTVDGRPAGRTPAELPDLTPGAVRLELALDGFVPVSKTVQLAAGPQTQDFHLEKAAPQAATLILPPRAVAADQNGRAVRVQLRRAEQSPKKAVPPQLDIKVAR